MSDHMPECPWPAHPCSHTTMHDREPLFCVDCLTECICYRLRACEQRVTDEIWGAIREGSQYKSGFEGGLDAARETVAGMPIPTLPERYGILASMLFRGDVLAAIDARRAIVDRTASQ